MRDRRWAELEVRVAELQAGLDNQSLARVPLGRDLIPGNAWDDYLTFFDGSSLRPIPLNLEELIWNLRVAERSGTEAFISDHSDWIEKLQKGARRQTARAPPARMRDGQSTMFDEHSCVLDLTVSLCIAKARLQAEAGHPREAMDLLVDVCLCGRDFAGTRLLAPWRYGLKTLERALKELQHLSLRLDPPALQDLERQLALLDEYFPDTSRADALDHLLFLGELLIEGDRQDRDLVPLPTESARRRWRYLYSTRLEGATSFAAADRLARRALAIRDLPWAAAEPAAWKLQGELEALGEPAVSFALRERIDVLSGRQIRTYLRMVRIAVRYRRTGELQILENAQGEVIATKQIGDSLLIYNERLPEAPNEAFPLPSARAALESFLIELPLRR